MVVGTRAGACPRANLTYMFAQAITVIKGSNVDVVDREMGIALSGDVRPPEPLIGNPLPPGT